MRHFRGSFGKWLTALMLCGLIGRQSDALCAEETNGKPSAVRGDLLLIVGAPGNAEYDREFQHWAQQWTAAATTGDVNVTALGTQTDGPGAENAATLENIKSALQQLQQADQLPLWIILIGHGTFDGRTAKFNLPGPDLDPAEFQRLLDPLKRPLAIVDCTSASGPFIEALSRPKRIVITATSSGNEVNFSRFGGFLADALQNPRADLDKDQQVSLLEAFLDASRRTLKSYEGDGQLPTEHAMLDDNGDARAVPMNGFHGTQIIDRDGDSNLLPDGVLAHQWHLVLNQADARLPPKVIQRRNELELQITQLRQKKTDMSEDEYFAALEPLFVELAKLLVPADEESPRPNAEDSMP